VCCLFGETVTGEFGNAGNEPSAFLEQSLARLVIGIQLGFAIRARLKIQMS
jgi:hypothetical protein